MMRITPFSRVALAAAAFSLAACSGTPDAEPAAQAEAPADSAAAPQQPASPRDTAETQLAGQRMYVDYGRPSMRGRTIMGGLVPYGQVWRTGANEATTLVVPGNVTIGGTPVPAGTYTLYTLPGETEWQLIVNKQTGQWGTEYDQAQDLARIPMTVERTAAPVEQLTITVQPESLVLEWENTRASVAIAPAS
jgi:hypothetical protein